MDKKSSTNNNWMKIVLYIIGGIVLIGILKTLTQLFSSHGPIQDGVAEAMGAAANLVNGLINGCEAQGECNSTDEKGCGSEQGCKWTPSTTSGQPGSCLNTTGKDPTSGSFFAPSCILGMGSIFALCGLLLLTVIGPLIRAALSKKNENRDIASKTTGKSESEVFETVAKESKTTAEEAKKKLEAKEDAKPLTDAKAKELGKAAVNVESRKVAQEGTNGQSGVSAADNAQKQQEIKDNFQKDMNDHIEEMKKNSEISETDAKDIYDAVEGAHAEK